MNIEQLKRYIEKTLHQLVTMKSWELERRIPLFLRENYVFFVMNILNTQILIMGIRSGKSLTPSVIEKHTQNLKKYWKEPVCLWQDTITLYTRKRLIEKQIQFAVPDTHLYLPCLGTELREYYKSPQTKKECLSPSTQSIYIYILERHLTHVTTKDITGVFLLSLMSVTRSLGELAAHGLCEKTGTRKNTMYIFDKDQQISWKKAENFMRSPIQKKIWINKLPANIPVCNSGLNALSEYSNIASGNNNTVAVNSQTAKTICNTPGIETLPYAEPDVVELEIWKYDPSITAREETVDPRSLYLTFAGTVDERISMELERMKEQW
jgi:hypothetical protein